MHILEFSSSQYNYILLFCIPLFYIKKMFCSYDGGFIAMALFNMYVFFLLFTENQLFGCFIGRRVFDMDHVFVHLLQAGSTVCVLHMIENLIMGRDKPNDYIAIRSWLENLCISCQ